jgi:hypothetical protein
MGNIGCSLRNGKTPPEGTMEMQADAIERTHPSADPVRSAVDCLRVGFQVIGFDWRYVYVNPAAAAHGRRTVAQLSGRTMMECYPGIVRRPQALHG